MLRLTLALALLAPCGLLADMPIDTPPSTPTPTPKPPREVPVAGLWQGSVGLYQNNCGASWAKSRQLNLRVRLNPTDTGFSEDYGPYCTARAMSRAGWWRGRWYYPDAEHYGLIDLYIGTRWVSPETGYVYRYHYNWWWSHNPERRRQRAKYWIKVEAAGWGDVCRAKYQGWIKRRGK